MTLRHWHWHTTLPNLFGILVLLLGFSSLDGERLGRLVGMVGVNGQQVSITGFKNLPRGLFFFDHSTVSVLGLCYTVMRVLMGLVLLV
jgi:hypothetical protein